MHGAVRCSDRKSAGGLDIYLYFNVNISNPSDVVRGPAFGIKSSERRPFATYSCDYTGLDMPDILGYAVLTQRLLRARRPRLATPSRLVVGWCLGRTSPCN